jgi:hypothetical protein
MKTKLIGVALVAGLVAFLLSYLVMASALSNPYVNLSSIAVPFAIIIGLIVANIFLTVFAADSANSEEYIGKLIQKLPNIKIESNQGTTSSQVNSTGNQGKDEN